MNFEKPVDREQTTAESDSPWGDAYQKDLPPFSQDQEKLDDTKASNGESEDYFMLDGVECRNIDKIDISTEEGKLEWLDGLLENSVARHMQELEDAQNSGDEELIQEAQARLRYCQRQQKILQAAAERAGDNGSIMGALQYEYHLAFDRCNKLTASSSVTERAINVAAENYHAASDILSIMEEETARRDPNYFGQREMEDLLTDEVKRTECEVSKTMMDGYVGEDGFVHLAPNGEKIPTAATAEAELVAREAKQDVATFGKLMQEYNASVDYQSSRAIKKVDFAPVLENFIAERNAALSQIAASGQGLERGTPAYEAFHDRRRQIVRERNSARRLKAKYFEVPQATIAE